MSLEVAPDRTTIELRALAHPVRLRMLSLLTGASMTAAEVARELSLTHANASYHLRQLHAAGAIVSAGEERIRGGIAKRYRYLPAADETPAPQPAGSADRLVGRRAMYDAMTAELRRRAGHEVHAGYRGHLTDAELWVDPEAWADIRAQVHAASLTLHRVAKPPRTPGTIRVNATMALFEMERDA
jgi:DNA-binding transcriptional ArsR family regulator